MGFKVWNQSELIFPDFAIITSLNIGNGPILTIIIIMFSWIRVCAHWVKHKSVFVYMCESMVKALGKRNLN